MNILHIDSSILGPNSVSRKLSADIMARLHAAHPDAAVTYRDLGQSPVPHLSGTTLMAAQNRDGDHDPAAKADLALGGAVLTEFLAADIVVIGVALYNFTVPSQLKAWIDRIVIAGQTFRYGPDGRPEGLAGGKRVILGVARGGFYRPGAPAAPFEHAENLSARRFRLPGHRARSGGRRRPGRRTRAARSRHQRRRGANYRPRRLNVRIRTTETRT